ncbi:PAS domain S-box protein [Asticcacaulis sp. 201]|uniref:PAS domain S-box protein n=1 Tax=Asticcacaulis sp. 201 TaxID=3028787 RepID=UPI0029165D35|nr:PAS domain S-box protein [Asticcacaulis sp. 201]MDV6333006.1 PAS domain S-box protein [Asticcacaulis sp. 201]
MPVQAPPQNTPTNETATPLAKAIFDNAIDGLITIDDQGIIESFNPACEKIFGYEAVEIVGCNIRVLMPEPYHSEHDGYLEHYKTTGKARIIGTSGREVSGQRKDGTVFPLDLSISRFEHDGRQHFCGIIRDISQHKQREKELRDSESRIRSLVTSTVDGLITINASGQIDTFNPACEKIFGYTAAELAGKNIRVLMPEPYHSEHDGYLENYQRTGDAHIIGTSGREVRGKRKDGSEFPMDLSISRYELDDGVYFCGIIRDITKAKAEEDNRQRLMQRLMESNTELERFAYVASHDMQEPIRMVANFSEILVNEYQAQLDTNGREFLEIINSSAIRLQDMVHDLLQYARLGRESLSFGEVNLEEQLEHVKINLSELIRDSGVEIYHAPLPIVSGSSVQLLRLLQNLISNAIKYQPANAHPVIRITCDPQDDYWRLAVSDNGIGISADFVTQVFEPFRRLHTWDAINGTGLGLAVCRKIVESHDGQIWAESSPGHGSTFYFTLPKARGRHPQ